MPVSMVITYTMAISVSIEFVILSLVGLFTANLILIKIIDTINGVVAEDGFSVVKTYDELKNGKYSFNPGGYFDVRIEHIEITQ